MEEGAEGTSIIQKQTIQYQANEIFNLQIDKMFHFPSGTFSYKPKYLKRNSNSTCKHDMTFLQQSRPTGIVSSSVVATNNDECDISNLPKGKLKSMGSESDVVILFVIHATHSKPKGQCCVP